ncbi:MAG TPA: hypothetical protein VFV72_02470 [Candidatus Limnocylindrales bacterium]|nr:hypothetical protein [Candidatus Limnocylindrales bacterium]
MFATSLRRRSVAIVIASAAVVAGCGFQPSLAQPGGDPSVRGNLGPDFLWAVGEPTRSLGSIDPDEARAIVDRAAAAIPEERDEDFPISIVALFETADEAEAHARTIRDVLADSARWYADPANAAARAARDDAGRQAPITPPEEAFMRDNLLDPGERGVGWGGDASAANDAVYTLGPLLVVTGLESDSFATDAEPPLHPLAHLLGAQGADVRLERDEFGEGSIVADVSCSVADPAVAAALADAIGDSIVTGQLNTRPPWLGAPLTADEALARATYRRWIDGFWTGANDPKLYEFAQQFANAGSAADREAALKQFQDYLVKQGLANIKGELDPAVMALIIEQPDTSDSKAHDAWKRDISGRMGGLPVHATDHGEQLSSADYDQVPWTGSIRVNRDRLEFGWLSFGRFSAAMPNMAAYLEAQGCTDLKLGTVDFDDVRGD